MSKSQDLWNAYHSAVKQGKIEMAKRILQSLQGYKGAGHVPTGGCSKCKRRMF